MPKYFAFYKPYGVLSQFTPEGGHPALNEYHLPKDVYAAGRLDHDSEGLLLLTDDGVLIKKLLTPGAKEKCYWVQVERTPTSDGVEKLKRGVLIGDYQTLPCRAQLIEEPHLPPRDPPIRFRKNVETTWMEIFLTEGKNRQVRKMTAAIGHPTLRLVRVGLGKLHLKKLNLKLGEYCEVRLEDIL